MSSAHPGRRARLIIVQLVEGQGQTRIPGRRWARRTGSGCVCRGGTSPRWSCRPNAHILPQAPHTSLVKALYDYDAAADGELSIKEDDVLRMYETEGDWILAQHDSADGAGYVPANYVEEASGPTPSVPIPAAPAIVVPDSVCNPSSEGRIC